ncbi:transposase [Brevibacillus laterosporus]|uniref:Transposase n=1 Tax=Brevibacillus laterosporus TaxID=1465 RepID=A0A518VFS7_BRELA|nr:transposase [Brevibacillus laterosporus]
MNHLDHVIDSLSSYSRKTVTEDGKIIFDTVYDDYFLTNNKWYINYLGKIPNFEVQFKSYKGKERNVPFLVNSFPVNLELKFVFYQMLFTDKWELKNTFSGQAQSLRRLTQFLNEKYKSLSSLLHLDIEKTQSEWVLWLKSIGIKTEISKTYRRNGRTYPAYAPEVYFLRTIYNALNNLTDQREEWEKDKWDIRILNQRYNLGFNPSTNQYFLDFSGINNRYVRMQLKKYFKQRLLGRRNFTWGTAISKLSYLVKFLNYIFVLEPAWNDLKHLSRKHIEKFIEWLHEYVNSNPYKRIKNPERFIKHSLDLVQGFLEDLRRFEYAIAPEMNTRILIFPKDKPNQPKKSFDQIDYIPDYVLQQVFENINLLHSQVQPVFWVAFKTGLRISDVLGLTQYCLVKLNEKYQIVTDIEKTYCKGHSIPIDEELANIIAVLIKTSIESSNDDNNPEKYIFVRYRGSRKGQPYGQSWIRDKLNELALQCNITDESGMRFHFKTHQFRHTFAVKMLNSGADILTVQELLAHSSPEMTMRYARLLDDTKRKAFETAVKQGIFSFDIEGKILEIGIYGDPDTNVLDILWRDHKLTAIDNPYGSCHARLNGNCPYSEEPPCLTCNSGKPCKDLAVGLSDMDIAKYEIHIQSTSKMIEIAQQYGREEIANKNKKNLNRLQGIYNTIKQGNIIFGQLDRVKRKQGVSNV